MKLTKAILFALLAGIMALAGYDWRELLND